MARDLRRLVAREAEKDGTVDIVKMSVWLLAGEQDG